MIKDGDHRQGDPFTAFNRAKMLILLHNAYFCGLMQPIHL